MRALVIDAQVNYVAAPATEGGKSSIKKGKIVDVRHQATTDSRGVAFIDIATGEKDKDGNLKEVYAIAEHSLDGEIGTFHFPDEAKDVKESDSFKQAPEPAKAAAAPATTAK